MAGRGQVSWLPGVGRPHLPGNSVSSPVAGADAPAASFTPVTVAGPRRLLTELPLTTDRIYASESIRQAGFSARWLDLVTNPTLNSSILRATRTSSGPSVASCFRQSRARFRTPLAWGRSSMPLALAACSSSFSHPCWGFPIPKEMHGASEESRQDFSLDSPLT